MKELVDVKTLTTAAHDAFKVHNTEQFISINHPDGHPVLMQVPSSNQPKVILCPDGQLKDGKYLDPVTSQALTVDHLRLVSI